MMKTRSETMTGNERAERGRGEKAARPFVMSRRYAGQPLKQWQTQRLSILAKRGFDRVGKFAERPSDCASDSAWFKQWKHEQQGRALKREAVSLTEVFQRDYRDLEIHFQGLAGEVSARTFQRALASDEIDEGRRQILHHLRLECERWGLAWEYAETISRSLCGCELEQMDPEQVKKVLGIVRQRGAAKRAREMAAQGQSEK